MADVTISYKGSSIATMSASGTKTLETAGMYCEDDIEVEYIKPSTSAATLQSKSATPTESAQTITPDSGYDGLSQVSVGAISSSYVGSNVPRQAAQTITPTTSNQTIASGKYLTGTQTIQGDSNLVASNIKSGTSIFGVAGTYTGSGGSNWTKIASKEFSVSTTSTSNTTVGDITLPLGKYNSKNNIVWVHIRDKEGKRDGYFYGSDTIFLNYQLANGSTSSLITRPLMFFRVNSAGTYTGVASAYGVFCYSLTYTSSAHYARIYSRYSSSTLTIDGTYVCDVYVLTTPSGLTLFD